MEAALERDRRLARRLECAHCHRIRSARTRTGDRIFVINVCAGGMLIETTRRLLPGSFVELQMETDLDRVSVRGRVLRCSISDLRAAGVTYRSAVLFDRHLPWFVDDPSCEASTSQQRSGRPDRARPTQTVI